METQTLRDSKRETQRYRESEGESQSIGTQGGRHRYRDMGERLRDIEIWGRDSRYGDLGDRLESIETWFGGSKIQILEGETQRQISGVEIQRHRALRGRLGDTENQRGILRAIGTWGQRLRDTDTGETQRRRLGWRFRDRESERETQSYRDLWERLRDIETSGETQRYRDLNGVETQRYRGLRGVIQSSRDLGQERLRDIEAP